MLATTILVDDTPCCVVRPTDRKALERFIRNGKSFLLAENAAGKVSHRGADEREAAIWQRAFDLHRAWGGDEEGFFGTPL